MNKSEKAEMRWKFVPLQKRRINNGFIDNKICEYFWEGVKAFFLRLIQLLQSCVWGRYINAIALDGDMLKMA